MVSHKIRNGRIDNFWPQLNWQILTIVKENSWLIAIFYLGPVRAKLEPRRFDPKMFSCTKRGQCKLIIIYGRSPKEPNSLYIGQKEPKLAQTLHSFLLSVCVLLKQVALTIKHQCLFHSSPFFQASLLKETLFVHFIFKHHVQCILHISGWTWDACMEILHA